MKVILLLTIFFSFKNAQAEGGNLLVQPIVGVERVVKVLPTPHTKQRTVVGMRLAFGPPIIALEAEVTRASDSEFFPDQNLTVEEESYAAKLGLRSHISLLSILKFYLRAGGQARKTEQTITENSVESKKTPSINIAPYAGAGLDFHLGRNLFANAGVTVIFTGKPRGSDQEYQGTLGLGMRF